MLWSLFKSKRGAFVRALERVIVGRKLYCYADSSSPSNGGRGQKFS
jgi:hypothetical protein